MKLILSIFTAIAVAGCATTSNGPEVQGSAASSVRNFINNIEPGLKPAAATACSLVLNLAVTAQDRADVKKDLFVVASVVGSASPDQTPGELSKAIQGALPKTPEYKQLADAIAGGFAIALPFIKGDPQLFLKVTSDLAAGCAQTATL